MEKEVSEPWPERQRSETASEGKERELHSRQATVAEQP